MYNKAAAIQKIDKRLEEIEKLEFNWDSYEADPINKVTIKKAQEISHLLIEKDCPPPFIVPTNSEGVSLEWWTPEYEFSIEICPYKPDYIYFMDENHEWEGPFDDPKAEYYFDLGLKTICASYELKAMPTVSSVEEMLLLEQ